MGKKIAIIGTTASMMDAPYGDESWEIWGLNGAYTQILRYDRWFDMHDKKTLEGAHDPKYFDFLAQCDDRLMLAHLNPDLPKAQAFPYLEILEYFNRRYFTNTVAWLTAYAIMQEPEEIGVWGVNMATDTEYMHQRACCEFWLGYAESKGIKITVPDGSELLKGSRLYGVEPLNPIMVKLPDKKRELMAGVQENNREMRMTEDEVSKINGLMAGIRMTCDVARGNTKSKELVKLLDDFENAKSEETKMAASGLNSKLIELYEKKAFYEGAMGYHNWLNLNFGG